MGLELFRVQRSYSISHLEGADTYFFMLFLQRQPDKIVTAMIFAMMPSINCSVSKYAYASKG